MFLPRARWSWRRYERRRPGNEIHRWSPFCCDSFFSWILLKSLRHCRTEMANFKQAQQMIPLITCEVSFSQNVSELIFGVEVFDLDLGVHINSIKQPIKCNSLGSGNVSDRSRIGLGLGWVCKMGEIVGSDESPLGGVAKVVPHGVKVVDVHGE